MIKEGWQSGLMHQSPKLEDLETVPRVRISFPPLEKSYPQIFDLI